MTIRFGTDGWRGVIARDFTFDNVRRVASAIGQYLEEAGSAAGGVGVGYDRRFLSDRYAAEAAGVLAARGILVRLSCGYIPTPVLSWAVRDQGLAGGVMITASHNPAEWNGVKLKETFGGSSRTSVNDRIEEILRTSIPPGDRIRCLSAKEGARAGLIQDLQAGESYAQQIRKLVDFEAIRAARLAVGVDAMHGCGSPLLRGFLEEAGCRVVELHPESNPGFRGVAPEPTESRLPDLLRTVKEEGLALGLATDGDADRIGAVDERGRYFSPQRILAVLTRYLKETKGLGGDIAKTVSATSMLDLLADQYGLRVFLTPVGFKHIGEVMIERSILIGGEESGGIGIPAHLPERDGVLNGLLLAEIVARTGKGLRAYLQEVFDQVGHFTYDRVDLPLDPETASGVRTRVAEIDDVGELAAKRIREILKLDGTRLLFEDYSWLLIRPSGTEPVLRLYAEARNRAEVEALLGEGRRLAGI